MNKEIVVTGEVVSGSKQGQRFVSLPWVKNQINAKLGFNPFFGTLNLRLSKEKDILPLHNSKGIIIEPEAGYCEGKCFRALVLKKVEGAVVLPMVPDYPPDLLEIIAPIDLRETFGLTDGMTIEVSIRVE